MHRSRRRRQLLAFASISLLTAILLIACGSDDSDTGSGGATATESTAASETAIPQATPVHWTYHGEEGPEHWGELDPLYATCSEGERQSPIDFSSTTEQDLANIMFNYTSSSVNVQNNGHTIMMKYDAGSSISVHDTQYDLLQFHFHAPAEHTLDGVQYDAELHFVHQSAGGSLAVVGVFITTGAEERELAQAWEHLPAEPGPLQTVEATINAHYLLPANQATFRYDGSLTTPPCSEDVLWLMMTEPISISDAQFAALDEIMEANNRPVQPLNDREVLQDTTP